MTWEWEWFNGESYFLCLFVVVSPAIATSEVKDVREVLDFYNQFDDPIEAFRENQRRLQVMQRNFLPLLKNKDRVQSYSEAIFTDL